MTMQEKQTDEKWRLSNLNRYEGKTKQNKKYVSQWEYIWRIQLNQYHAIHTVGYQEY